MRSRAFWGDRSVELQEFLDPSPGAGEVMLGLRPSSSCDGDRRAAGRDVVTW